MTNREYRSLPRELAAGLQRLDLRVRALAVVRGIGFLCAVAGAVLAAGLLVDWLIDVGVAARTVLLVGVIVTTVITLAAAILRPLFRRTTASELGALVDSAYPELGERIESAVELSDPTLPERHRGSSVMRSQLLAETVRQSRSVDFGAAAAPTSALRWLAIGSLTLLLLFAPFGLSRDGYGLLLTRFLTPWSNLERATNLYFWIENGDRTVARGTDVTIAAEPRWRIKQTSLPDVAWLEWRNGDGETDARRMAYDADSGTFRATIPHVFTSFDYQVSAGRVQTRTYHIDVVEAPAIERLTLEIEPPAYTGRPARTLDGPAGRIEVFERSQLTFFMELTKPVVSGELQWLNTEADKVNTDVSSAGPDMLPVTLADDRRSGTVALTADRGGLFRIMLLDERDVTNLEREPWELVILADEPPLIEWADADAGLDITGAALEVRGDDRLPLAVNAADDVGIAELELHAEIVQRSEPLEPLVAEAARLDQTHVEHTFSWDLSQLTLREGDLLAVRARAVDGRPQPGPQDAWTASRLIRITADAEPIEKSLLTEKQQKLRDILEAVQENVRQDRATTESLQKTAREAGEQQQPEGQQEDIAELTERQQKLTQRLDQLAAVFDQHPLLSNMAEETREVGSGPLDAAREQFRQAEASPPPQQREYLTNAAEQLARADEQLDRLLKRFDELAELEQDLQQLQQLAENAERLSNEVSDFEQQWEQLAQAQELAAEQRQAREQELAEQHENLQINQEALTGALDRLLEERPEVLEAATQRQLERLQELAEQASRLAEREDRLADALEQEPAAASAQEPPQTNAGDQFAEPQDHPEASSETPPSNDPSKQQESPSSPTDSDTSDQPSPTNTEDSEQPAEREPPPEESITRRQQQLAEDAARLALETVRSKGVEAPSAQQAREFAENSLQAAEDAQTGLLDDAAESAEQAAEAARQTAEQLQDPTDPAPARLRQQAEQLAKQQAALAEELRQQSESPAARQQAQAEGQQQLAEQTGALSEQLQEIAERLGSEPLDNAEQSERAESAQQSSEEAKTSMQSAQQELEQGQSEDAVPPAREAAESLKQTAQQAGEAAQSNAGEQPSPVPGEVGEQVADARRQLGQAGKQLRQKGPSQSETGQADESSQEQPPSGESEDSSDAEQPTAEPPESEEERPLEELDTPADSSSDGEPQSPSSEQPPSEQSEPNASQSMQQVAESLRQAARQLGIAPSPSDKPGQPGEQDGDPSEGSPGSQSGVSGKNPISLAELEAELRKMSNRDWGRLPGQVESELFQSTQKKPDADYARLIRLYFEEISRPRLATENLVPNDNEL